MNLCEASWDCSELRPESTSRNSWGCCLCQHATYRNLTHHFQGNVGYEGMRKGITYRQGQMKKMVEFGCNGVAEVL